MATEPCAVSGNVADLTGTAIAGAVIVFTRDYVAGQDGSAIVPFNKSVTANGSGSFTVDLMPGAYQAATTIDRGAISFRVVVPDEVSGNFSEMIDGPDTDITPLVLQQVLDARNDVIAAQEIVIGAGDRGVVLSDQYGFATAEMSPDGLWTEPFEITAYSDGSGDLLIVDQYGLGDAAGAGGAAAVSNFIVTTPLMPDALYGVSGVEYSLHTGGLTQDRAVECSLLVNGSEGFSRHGQYEVAFDPAQLSGSATVSLHTSKTGATYGEQVATVYVAPQPPVNTTPSILALGDSILTRGGASIIGAYLEDWGYTPTFVGTLADHGEGVHGPVNAECKPGHLMADQTYAITTRVSPLAPGDEAAYAAMTTEDKRLKNTIIRAASGEAAGDIRNGYVLDFANYFSRHSLTPTDLLVVTYGTNDIRDIAAASIYDHIYDEASLIIRRWFASYPNKHVVLGLPGTAWRADRNLIWAASYSEVIRALIKAAADETTANGGTGKAIVAASWAGATPYAGYDLLDATADETDAATGAEVRDIEDEIHPTGGTRWATHKTIAAAIACAAEGTI